MLHDLRDRAGRVFRHDAGIWALRYNPAPQTRKSVLLQTFVAR